ncbi:MAG TPA: SMC family ATPase [Candidatus Atopostipes pullistercoris]|uniref:Nuclease SbcCD subunit C n=1 Tax=Candidatus Atopostipes pullistercoris TaxID=2838467 RepID=A0A9D2JYP8_9LACT|nr:SMC family ATPase [Candidatus Atopostipes pullistercoris]
MRPTRLVMNAFGPYRGKVDLDFTKFNNSSIYLVSGPTGAGKTTIFDGICYALYNKASSTVRDTDMLKSQFATDEDRCFVELTFEIGTTSYRVKRIPKQKGPGARGNTINQAREVEFYKEGELLDTGTEADKAIEHLLGLSYEQFRQIVLLPQGEFRKLLLSNSREKEIIFRNIFGTEMIQNFQENLRIKARDLNKAYEEYGMLLDQSLASIEFEADDELAKAIEKTDYEKILNLLAEKIDKENHALTLKKQAILQFEQLERKNERWIQQLNEYQMLKIKEKELAERSTDIQTLKKALIQNDQAREIKREHDKLKELESEREKLAQKLQEKQEKLIHINKEREHLLSQQERSKEDEAQLEDIREAIKQLEEERTLFEKRDQLNAEALAAEKEQKEMTAQIKQLEEEAVAYDKKIQTLSGNLEELSLQRSRLEEKRKELAELEDAVHKNQQEKEHLEKLLGLQDTLAHQIKKDQELSTQLHKSQKQYDQARQHYFGNLAGILAVELVDEEACPVCGSVHHPHPAQMDENTITKAELEKYEQTKNKDQTACTQLMAEIRQTEDQINEQKASLSHFEGEYSKGLEEVSKEEQKLKEKQQQLQGVIRELEDYISKEAQWRKDLEKAQYSNQKNALNIQKQKTHQQMLREQLEKMAEDVQVIEKKLTHTDVNEVEFKMNEKKKSILNIQGEATRIQETLNKKEIEHSQVETSIEILSEQQSQNKEKRTKQKELFESQLEKYEMDQNYSKFLLEKNIAEKYQQQIKTYENDASYTRKQRIKIEEALKTYGEASPAVAELEEELEKTRALKREAEDTREKIIRKVSRLENSYQEIQKNYESSKELLGPLAVYQELSEVANGSTNRTNRVSFERYVLSIYFSEILVAANKRFEKMTNHRYELVRREEKTKGGAADGLELNVFDRYSGHKRSVRSLSGGETFKASLSLALGLSDIIQSQQGGVRVDTLFIDEGFGTLDANSLESAVETLMELQESGRLIGIISHVDELKDRIPSRILVESKKEGSHARIEIQ